MGGALSLAQCQLAAGDRISMKYKFGNESMIVFKVISVDRGQALLPELVDRIGDRAGRGPQA